MFSSRAFLTRFHEFSRRRRLIEERNKIIAAVSEIFDLRPYGIVQMLDLLKPIYLKTASYGHFGRDEFSWEKIDRAAALKAAAK